MLVIGPSADLQGACKCHLRWAGPFTPTVINVRLESTLTVALKSNLAVVDETTVVTLSWERCPRDDRGIPVSSLQYQRPQDVVK